MPKKQESISVGFYGKYVPLQGVEYIVRAASLLGDGTVTFELIGSGQTYAKNHDLAIKLGLQNITFVERLMYTELIKRLQTYDVLLGIFGVTEKAKSVIPNKVYDAAALKKPIITADTPAIRELFSDGRDVVLCRGGDPRDLARAIMLLRDNPIMRQTIARNAQKLFEKYTSPKVIGEQLVSELAKRYQFNDC